MPVVVCETSGFEPRQVAGHNTSSKKLNSQQTEYSDHTKHFEVCQDACGNLKKKFTDLYMHCVSKPQIYS